MKTELSKIAQDFERGKINEDKARNLLLGSLGVMPSLNIDIRPKAQKHLKGYYGSNDSRAFEECHIDHYTQGYKQAEKDIMHGQNEA